MKYVLIVFAVSAASTAGAAPPMMKPGLWETIVSVEMSGVPGMPKGMQSAPPTTVRHCYRASDTKDLRGTLPKQSNCEIANWKESGKTVTWTMNCGGPSAMTMTGSMTYAGDSYSGVGKATMNMGGQSMQMTQNFKARRVGDCK
jgi:hypothetical protein